VPAVTAIGLACLAGSMLLAWLSAPATLHLSRDTGTAAATLEARVFGLVVSERARIDGIRGASMVRARTSGSTTPDRLVFDTAGGPVDLGRSQQLFAAQREAIADFLQTDGPGSLTLSSLDRGSEQRRFLFAQASALFLFAAGLGLGWMVIRSRFRPE
jgi:hypothetical protein